jgi:hypothetical protein
MSLLLFNNIFLHVSESFGIGLTAEDIVDRLLSTEYNKTGISMIQLSRTQLLNTSIDENVIPIFLTFFRKFMKPYDLVKMLVQRYLLCLKYLYSLIHDFS